MSGEPRPKERQAAPGTTGWNSTLRRRKRLAPRSPKRIAEAEARDEVRTVVRARAGGRCEARHLVPSVKCWGPLDVDEIESRGTHPGSHLDPDLCQLLCRAHHDWKHAHPAAALELGLRRHSTYDTPGDSMPERATLESCVCGGCFECPDGWHDDPDDWPCCCTADCALPDTPGDPE